MEKSCEHSSSFIFDWLNLILAGNKDMHESLYEFKFRPDTTTNLQSYVPLHIWKIVVNTLAPTFLIRSSSFFQVTRTPNKSGQSSNFGQIGTKGCRVIALDRCQKLVFAQYLENGWTEFNQILDTLYHWQDLCCYCKASFLRKFAPELQPLIDIRNWFLLNILRKDGQNSTKFCIHIILDKIYI